MKIVRIGQATWTVYATCDSRDDCPVLEFIAGLIAKRGNKVLADLQEVVPRTSPEHWARTELSEKLTNWPDLYEFRWPQTGGGTPRILWFYDENKVVICASGVNKKGKLKKTEIELADDVRKLYFAAKKNRSLTVVDIEEFDCGEGEDKEG